MAKIIRITIESRSGCAQADSLCKDKLVVSPDTVRYEYRPYIESDERHAYKWTYKTDSPRFKRLFTDACAETEKILDVEKYNICDGAYISFAVTYADRRRRKREFVTTNAEFRKCLSVIRQMIPGYGEIPEVLRTYDDE